MTIDQLLQNLRERVPGCIAALTVSLEDASLIGYRSGEEIDFATISAMARAFGDSLEHAGALAAIAGDGGAGQPKEVIILADDRICFGQLINQSPASMLAAVCRNTTNYGLLFSAIRAELSAAEASL